MTMDNTNACGCCEGLSPETPLHIHNRPGLSAVAYRAGTWATFRESMLAALSDPRFPALRALTTRDSDDFTIALLDAWAATADVLTFYQERIANESWLSTATEQKSIVELARLIGYELRPGVAAGTYLAFSMDRANMPEAQMQVTGNARAKEDYIRYPIPKGTRVQSIPGPDEQPQMFETMEAIEAMAEWNAIKPKLTQKQANLANDNLVLVLKGANLGLRTNDMICIVENGASSFKKIVQLVQDDKANTTSVYFTLEAGYRAFVEPNVNSFANVVGPSAALMLTTQGHQAFWSGSFEQGQDNAPQNMKQQSIYNQIRRVAYSANTAYFAGGIGIPNGVYVFRKRANVFGYNAAKSIKYSGNIPVSPTQWDEWPINELNSLLFLDGVYEDVINRSLVAVERQDDSIVLYEISDAKIEARTAYGMSAKSTKIRLGNKISVYGSTTISTTDWWGDATDLEKIRNFNIYAASEALQLAESPINDVVSGTQISLSGYFPELKKGMPVILFGEEGGTGLFVTELRFLKQVFKIKEDTVVIFDQRLEHNYIRSTLTLNANVVRATHGETVKENLGSGDAAKPFQKFVLKQAPLTFTSADTPTGTQTSLEVRVNDILWKEVPSLYGVGANEKVYITRQDDEAQTTLVFGDGITGSRLPTGQNNVTAVYRKGIGIGGLVRNDQLTQLMDRPLGVKAVTNPMPGIGAEDHEQLKDARKNATLTIYTLDRVVSLQDYEDFARAFGGIAKALATLTWHGRQQRIHLTIAGYNGAEVLVGSTVYNNLYNALQKSGIPGVSLDMFTYQRTSFLVEAKLRTHPDYIRENVWRNAENRLHNAFFFENRQFGQGVARSEVLAILQDTPGVVAVDLDYFYKKGSGSKTLEETIRASIPLAGDETPEPAELLTIDAQPIVFVEMP